MHEDEHTHRTGYSSDAYTIIFTNETNIADGQGQTAAARHWEQRRGVKGSSGGGGKKYSSASAADRFSGRLVSMKRIVTVSITILLLLLLLLLCFMLL